MNDGSKPLPGVPGLSGPGLRSDGSGSAHDPAPGEREDTARLQDTQSALRQEVEAGATSAGRVHRDDGATGIGIETAKLPELFRLFSQIDATLHRSDGGLGVGLAPEKHIVDLHGGVVAAISPGLGRGACFTVRLPSAESEIVSRT